jgi:hypothetical protein
MPDPGRAGPENYRVQIPSPKPDYPALPWKCTGVTMLSVSFEVLKDPLLDRLPSDFNRTVPSYCRLFVIDQADSPVGPFHEAILALGCRYNMRPVSFVTASLTNNPKTLAAGLCERGFPSALGAIELEASAEQARATVSDQNGPLLSVAIPALQTIEPGRLAYDQFNAFRTTGTNGSLQAELVALSPDIEIEQAAISRTAPIEYLGAGNTVWHILRSRNVISAQVVRGTRTFAVAKKPS